MPNWCSNFVQITHSDPAKIAALAAAAKEGKFCEFVIPMPEELRDTTAPSADGNDWYTFCTSRWGTKWDVDPYGPVEVQDGTHLSFGFDSAWAPPIGIYEALLEDGFTVDAMYYEPGMGFCGRWIDGNDGYYELSGMSADRVEQEIDPDINEQFAISEQMAELEAERAENEQ
jgi:hypothetical protein